MKFKPDENIMVAYLYGELNQKEKEKVEYFLQTNPNWRQEYEKMLSLRKLLQQLPDQEVQEPMMVRTGNGGSGSLWTGPFFRKIASVAAVLLVLMAGGKLTDATVSWGDSGIFLGFGDNDLPKEDPPAASTDLEEVNLMISAALSQFKANELDSLSQISIHRINELDAKQLQQMEQYTLRSKKLIESYYQELAGQNRQILEEYLLMASYQQAGQTEALLIQFAQGIQQMREEDLVYLQTRLNLIEEDKNLFQYETGKVLSNLIYHAANQERQ